MLQEEPTSTRGHHKQQGGNREEKGTEIEYKEEK